MRVSKTRGRNTVKVQILLAALLKDTVYRFMTYIFVYVIFHFIVFGCIPDYSNNYYVIYGIAGVILLLCVTTKPNHKNGLTRRKK